MIWRKTYQYGLSLVIVLVSFVSYAQKPEKWIELGDEAMQKHDYYAAFSYYENAITLDSTRAEFQYKYAESARFINNYKIAARFYEKVYRKERGRFFPDGAFHLANMKKHIANYKDASKYWRKAKSKRRKDSFIYQKSAQEYKSTEWAKLEKNKFLEGAEVTPLPVPINSKNSEFAAVLGKDSSLFYSALPQKSSPSGKLIENSKGVQVYSSTFDQYSKKWTGRIAITNEIADLGRDIGNGSFNKDKSIYYFSACDTGLCRIYSARVVNNELIEPSLLNEFINEPNSSNTQPFFASNGTTEELYFVSNRINSQGKLDIWLSKMRNGEWQEAENLGKNVNTQDDDVTPFYLPEHQRLYFSSSWHYGFGGYDIFYSEKDEYGKFQLPNNMGQPINTPANDLYFSIYNDNEGFLTSNRDGSSPWSNGTCCNDIYSFRMVPIVTQAKDTLPVITEIGELGVYLPIALYFHNDEPNPRTTDTTTSLNYLLTYQNYKKLIPTYRKKYTEGIITDHVATSDSVIMHFFEHTAKNGVDTLEFVTKLLLRELDEGQRIELAIKGYASPLAQTDYNKNLTLRRIQSLVNYFTEYENGVFRKYLNDVAPSGGFLGFEKIPFGETKAAQTVSDNVNDQRNSVYSRAAALERKIEILAIGSSMKESLVPDEIEEKTLAFDDPEKSLGKIKRGKTLSHTFVFENTLNEPVTIEHVQPACGCTLVDFPKDAIQIKGRGEIPIEIDTRELNKGKNTKSIVIIANDGEIIQELKVTFWVE